LKCSGVRPYYISNVASDAFFNTPALFLAGARLEINFHQGVVTLVSVLHYSLHEGLFPLLFGQNLTAENHAKLLFTIGIPIGLRSAYYIKI
jgi:hypothetical protein